MKHSTRPLPFAALKRAIETLAAKEGYSVSQFLASAAGEKLAVVMTQYFCNQAQEIVAHDF